MPGSKRDAFLILLAALVVYWSSLRVPEYNDPVWNTSTAVSIAERGTADISPFVEDLSAKFPQYERWLRHDGERAFSKYSLAAPLCAAPFFWVASLFGVGADSWMVPYIGKGVASLFAALSAVFVYLTVRLLASRRQAWLVALVYAFGTATFSVSSQALFQHGVSQFFLAASLYALFRSRESQRALVWLGFLLACAVWARPLNVFAALAVGVFVIVRHRKGVLALLPGGCMAVLAAVIVNLWLTGRILPEGYGAEALRWDNPFVEGFLAWLVSPGRGLLVYSPVFVFALAGMVLVWRRKDWGELRALGIGVLATVAVAAMWHSQGGGYGYRLLADLSVPMSLFIVPVAGAIGRGYILPCAFGILAAISFFVHLAGAATFMTGPADVWKWNGGRLHCAFMTRPKLGDMFLDAQMDRYDSAYTGMRSIATVANDAVGGFLSALVPWPLPEDAIPYCRSEPIGIASRPHLPNVILISIDSLRADHLSCHGYGRDTSPSIDKIAAQSFRFTNAVSQAPWTLPSHASILTGRNPISHGLDRTLRKLGPRTDTLPVWLKQKGYYTGGVVSGPYMHRNFGFGRGFHEYDDALCVVEDPHSIITSPGIHAKTLDFLDRSGGRPFFLFLHYWDVHYDYNPPPPYDTYFDRTYTGSLDPSDFEHNADINRDMSPRDLQYLVSLYDGEIRYVDDHIGMLVQELSRRRLLEETILVITSDHGDEFYEHGEKGHSHSVYGELINVPLIIRLPGASGKGVVDRPVALIDIPPTILRLLGFKPDLDQQEGRSLLGMMRGDANVREVPIWSETQRGRKVKEALPTGRPLRTVRLGKYKYVFYEAGGGDTEMREYYDLATDPGERSPVPESELKARGFPPLSDHMEAWLEYWKERHKGGEEAEVNPEIMKALKKLGYAGS